MNTQARKAALQRYAASHAASRGMTLIEILVVLAIIGLIVGGSIVIPHLRRAVDLLDEINSAGGAGNAPEGANKDCGH